MTLGAALCPERWRRAGRGDRARTDERARRRPSAPDAKPAAADETPSAPTPSLRVTKLQFRGNRKVEDDAIKVNLKTAAA